MFFSELRARNAPPVSLEASVCLRKMSFTDALHVSASEGQSRVQVLSICVFWTSFCIREAKGDLSIGQNKTRVPLGKTTLDIVSVKTTQVKRRKLCQ